MAKIKEKEAGNGPFFKRLSQSFLAIFILLFSDVRGKKISIGLPRFLIDKVN